MRFEFTTANRIVFGAGSFLEVPSVAAEFGHRALVVTGDSTARAEVLCEGLRQKGITASIYTVPGEPTVDMVLAGIEQARLEGSDFVIGLGGGSALDAGKAIAALLTNDGHPADYLEGVGKGKALSRPALAYIAIPTTAGTGSEVTRNAVLASPEHQVKVSLRSPFMLPRLAVVDPELTYSLPQAVTASSGLDALTQLIEPYVSNAATTLTDLFCQDGIKRVSWALRRAYANGDDKEARAAMALASVYSGLALTNARLGAVHALAGPIGGAFAAPHGAICARLLPFIMEVNIEAGRKLPLDSSSLARFTDIARWLTGEPEADAIEGVGWLHQLCADLSVPGLRQYGLTEADIPGLVAQSQKANSMKGNPVALSDETLASVLFRAL